MQWIQLWIPSRKDILQTPGEGEYFTGVVRLKDFCNDPIPEIRSDIDTESQDVCQILIPSPRIQPLLPPRFEISRAGNEKFGPNWPLGRGSDMSTFFNTQKILGSCAPETEYVLLEKIIQLYFQSTPIARILSVSVNPSSIKFQAKVCPNHRNCKRISQSKTFQAKNYPKLAQFLSYPS